MAMLTPKLQGSDKAPDEAEEIAERQINLTSDQDQHYPRGENRNRRGLQEQV